MKEVRRLWTREIWAGRVLDSHSLAAHLDRRGHLELEFQTGEGSCLSYKP
jgi:hypothetical protein